MKCEQKGAFKFHSRASEAIQNWKEDIFALSICFLIDEKEKQKHRRAASEQASKSMNE